MVSERTGNGNGNGDGERRSPAHATRADTLRGTASDSSTLKAIGYSAWQCPRHMAEVGVEVCCGLDFRIIAGFLLLW